MRIRAIDHVVLTVRDIDRTLSFYERTLGMSAVRFGEGDALGEQELNLRQSGRKLYFRDPDGNLIEVANEVAP